MDVNHRSTSPDFAAGEAQFFRKLRTAFVDLQTQCEHEKLRNQRMLERDQRAFQKHIHDLEAKFSDLEKKRREAEVAHNKAALELQQEKDEAMRCQRAYREAEEARRRKYSALLTGSSAANLRLVIVCFPALLNVKKILACAGSRLKFSRHHTNAKMSVTTHWLELVERQNPDRTRSPVVMAKRAVGVCSCWVTTMVHCL